MDLRTRLSHEFKRRLARNPRYSMRAFARSLALHHTTVGRLLKGTRSPSQTLVRELGQRLGKSPEELFVVQRQEVAGRILAAAQSPDFRADSRWIAMKTGIELDDVNRALHFLIHERRLVMKNANLWIVPPQ
jgi:transcriptional regulator with XRE-family HTH domain